MREPTKTLLFKTENKFSYQVELWLHQRWFSGEEISPIVVNGIETTVESGWVYVVSIRKMNEGELFWQHSQFIKDSIPDYEKEEYKQELELCVNESIKAVFKKFEQSMTEAAKELKIYIDGRIK